MQSYASTRTVAQPAIALDPASGQPVAAFTGPGGIRVSARAG